MNNLYAKGDGILLIHNSYQQAGGEDRVFDLEVRLLQANGHRVYQYQDHNRRVPGMGRMELVLGTIWNNSSYRDVTALIQRERIGLVHVHNTFPLISPSVYYAARKAGVAVVQTLHNYRLLCPDAKLMRQGKVCEDCLGRSIPWPGVVRGCYQGSRCATAVTAAMTSTHRLLGTWSKCIDQYVALTEFARSKFIEGGLPAAKIAVKPNFIDPDPGCGRPGDYALFVGRLSPEKGLATLIEAWDRLANPIPLRVIGDGPLSPQILAAAARNPRIQWMGALPASEVRRQMQSARFLVCPSIWYESFGMIIVEAFSTGLPVIASNLGAMAELVEHERTGLLFTPGDPADLARIVQFALDRPQLLDYMRMRARREYEQHYTASTNYHLLMSIYEDADRHNSARVRPNALNDLALERNVCKPPINRPAQS
ncbi:MAG: glycosyltransferase [Bryobacterales bacterium]|jgi:glycosyltransferase involved in cell wall biosynthesis|nr:glycosyltransferase [Bryobacterales bacterium]